MEAASSVVEALSAIVDRVVSARAFTFKEVSGDRSGIAYLSDEGWLGDATDLMCGEQVSIEGVRTDDGVVVTRLRRTGRMLEERVYRRDGDVVWLRSGEVRIDAITASRRFVSRDSGRLYEAVPLDEIRGADAVMMLTRFDAGLNRLVAVAVGVERADETRTVTRGD